MESVVKRSLDGVIACNAIHFQAKLALYGYGLRSGCWAVLPVHGLIMAQNLIAPLLPPASDRTSGAYDIFSSRLLRLEGNLLPGMLGLRAIKAVFC